MSVLIIEKQKTYRESILDLEPGEKVKVPYEKRVTIAPMISKFKKELDYFKRRYSTEEISEEGQHLLLITRLEDNKDEPEART
ncbi:hypothetical protein [Pedobacter sp. Leaf170]|uniref:hypothetical protein n=1 Tax=Pedobacter sp. Leaf170 TaxID=2876558 RepID=UPI001E295E3A|nr:hypothetical protein [Pedobacter sp. Leaf170]